MLNDETMFTELKKKKMDRSISIEDGYNMNIVGEVSGRVKTVVDGKAWYCAQGCTVCPESFIKPHICESFW